MKTPSLPSERLKRSHRTFRAARVGRQANASGGGKIILASGSPRRIELMRAAGLRFEALPSGIDEHPPRPLGALRYVRWAARAKAEAVARRRPNAVIVGADTEVVLAGRIFGKPATTSEAREFLRTLSGRTHQVYTAVHVIAGRQTCSGVSRTHVTMRELSPGAIAAYLRTGEAQDKAGAYAIQGKGRRLVDSMKGPYDNVVGMPMHLVARLLNECGIAIAVTSPDGLQHDVTAKARHRQPRSTLGATRG